MRHDRANIPRPGLQLASGLALKDLQCRLDICFGREDSHTGAVVDSANSLSTVMPQISLYMLYLVELFGRLYPIKAHLRDVTNALA